MKLRDKGENVRRMNHRYYGTKIFIQGFSRSVNYFWIFVATAYFGMIHNHLTTMHSSIAFDMHSVQKLYDLPNITVYAYIKRNIRMNALTWITWRQKIYALCFRYILYFVTTYKCFKFMYTSIYSILDRALHEQSSI